MKKCILIDKGSAAQFGALIQANLAELGLAWSCVVARCLLLNHDSNKNPGECTSAAIAAMAAQVRQFTPDVVIARGGGKAIDTAKGVARQMGIALIACPTIASSDAPSSRLIVRYTDAHQVDGVDYLTRNPDAVVVDTVEHTICAAYSRNMHPPLAAAKLAHCLVEADRIATQFKRSLMVNPSSTPL